MSFVTALEAVRKLKDDIYVVTLSEDIEVVFCLPSFKQASQYSQILSVAEGNLALENTIYVHIFEEYVVDKYLATQDMNLQAGIPETVAKLILYLSGINDNFVEYTETLLDLFRSQTSSVLSVMRRTICSVFSGYTMADVDNLNYQELVRVFVEAETVLVEQGIIEERLKFKEPEKPKNFSIEKVIAQDADSYRRFDIDGQSRQPRLTEDPAYKAKMEELRIKQKLRQRGG